MRGRQQIYSERTWCVGRFFGQATNNQLDIRSSGVLYRRDQVDQAIRSSSHRLSIRPVDRHSINEYGSQIRVLGGSLSRHVGRPAWRQQGFDDGIRDVEIQLEPGLGTKLYRRLGSRTQRGPSQNNRGKQHEDASATNSSYHLALLLRQSTIELWYQKRLAKKRSDAVCR